MNMKKSLHIWIVDQFASTPSMPGQQRDYQYAKAFSLKRHHVTLWRSSYSHWSREETLTNHQPYGIDTDGNLKIINLKTSPLYYRNDYRRFLNMLSFAYALVKTSRIVSPPPDVIIATYPSPFAAFSAYRIATRFSAKFILEIGDLWPQVWVERKAFPVYHPFIVTLYALENYLYKRTRVFVSSLPYVNDYLRERGVKSHKFTWIPTGINPDDFSLDGRQDDSSDGVKVILNALGDERQRGNMNVVYIGGIGVGNRVDCIVQAAKILRDRGDKRISFHIIGDGHSRAEISNYVSEKQLNSVRIWPPVVRKAVPNILKTADVGILCLHNNPIYRYGVNLNKLYDYMAAGLPVVFAADVRNNLVEQYKTGITVPPSDPGAIASALQKLLSMSSEERRAVGARGSRGIAEDYDVNKLAGKYLELIES
jgi:glycosyltransferase involved in cell wall biosynthesis